MKPSDVVSSAKALGYDAVALTDTMTISGLPSFSNAAKKEGIKPIIGTRLRIYPDMSKDKKNKPYYLRVFCFTEESVKMLMGLLSFAFSETRYFRVPRLLLEDVFKLMESVKEDVLLTTGDAYSLLTLPNYSEIAGTIIEQGFSLACDVVAADTQYYLRQNSIAMRLADHLNLPMIICSPVLYQESSSSDALDVMRCITQPGMKMSERSSHDQFKDWIPKNRKKIIETLFFSFKKANTVFNDGYTDAELKSFIKRALAFEDEVCKRSEYVFSPLPPALPKMSEDDFATLKQKCVEGWSRLREETFGYKPSDLTQYKQRLSYELSLIKSKGFSAYFLLVADVVHWCKQNDIAVGFGRGSVGGSLVAFILGITDVDPIRFNLLFERFINPSRKDLPDIDLDFQSSKRELVIKYLIDKYGEDYVAGVSNYTTIAGAGALSDVCKRMGLERVPAFGMWFEKEHGVSVSLSEAIETSPQLAKFAKEHAKETEYAVTLEGTLRSFGKHAAGVIAAGVPISERAVVEKRSGANVVCWDKRSCEDFGLIKLDILGLSNLDIIDIAARHLKERKGIDFNPTQFPLDDEKVLKEFGEGRTVAIFQFASSMMQKILRDMYKSGSISFDDLSAATALGRPGPLDAGMVEDYIKRKNGEEEVVYPHYSAENAMKDTYGVLVYQETVMRVSRDMAGMSPIEAEGLRKAIGKKEINKMKSYREQFISGAAAGFAEVTLEDGTTIKVHAARKFMCADGKERTVEQALADNADITEKLTNEG